MCRSCSGERAWEPRGLYLSPSKCESITSTPDNANSVSSILAGASAINPEGSDLLGVPLISRATDVIFNEMLEDLGRMEDRIHTTDANDALHLTRCFNFTELNYLLRVSPSFDGERLGYMTKH